MFEIPFNAKNPKCEICGKPADIFYRGRPICKECLEQYECGDC